MKILSISLFAATILAPGAVLAQSQGDPAVPPACDGQGKRGMVRPLVEAWKMADSDHDGFISKEEFEAIPRIKNLVEEKRRNLFKRLDKNEDEKLSRQEIGRMGQAQNAQGQPMQRFWELDVDKSGGVSLEEFKAGKLHSKLPVEKQEELFRRLDSNHDGQISPKDRPEHPFQRDGQKPKFPGRPDGGKPEGPRMELRQIIRQLDKDGDGALSFEEFRAGPMVKELTEDEQEDRFQAMDKNHDQKLTPEDFPPPLPRGDVKRPECPQGGGGESVHP